MGSVTGNILSKCKIMPDIDEKDKICYDETNLMVNNKLEKS